MQKTKSLQRSLRAVIKSIGTASKIPLPYDILSHGLIRNARSTPELQQTEDGRGRAARGFASLNASPKIININGFSPETQAGHPNASTHAVEQSHSHGVDDVSPQFRPGLQPDGNITPIYRVALQRSHARSKRILIKRAQIYLQKRNRDSVRIPDVIWRMLRDEETDSSNPYVSHVELVRLPSGRQACFKGDTHEAILEIMLRTGSHAQIIDDEQHVRSKTPDNNNGRSFRALRLWGTPAQNASAVELLPSLTQAASASADVSPNLDSSHFQRDVSIDSASSTINLDHVDPNMSKLGKPSLVQMTWSTRPSDGQPIRHTLKQRPVQWSTASFAHYVRLLTTSRAWQVRSQGTQHGVEKKTATDRIVAELRSLTMDSSDLLKFVSSEAMDDILGFLSRHSRIQDMKDIVSSIETSSMYEISASNLDTLLMAAASQGDLHNFARSLQMMSDKGHRLTWKTWVALHRLAVNSPSRKLLQHVFRTMDRRGVLANAQAVKAVAADAVKIEIRRHLRKGGTMEGFIAYYNRRFSFSKPDRLSRGNKATIESQWMSKEAVAFMVEELLSLGRHQDALSIMDRYAGKDTTEHWRIIRSMLLAALRAKDTDAAVATISHFRIRIERSRSMLNAQVFDILFKLAWSTHSWNMLRVIWRYACLATRLRWKHHLVARQSMTLYPLPEDTEGLISGDQRLTKSLNNDELTVELDAILGDQALAPKITDEQQTVISEFELFKRWMGKFIVGIADGDIEAREWVRGRGLSAQANRLLDIGTSRRFLEDADHQRRKEDGLAMLHEDTLAWEHYVPTEPFHKKLDEAWRKDQQWKSTFFTAEKGLSELKWQHVSQVSAEQRADKVFDSLRSLLETLLTEGVKVPVVPIRFANEPRRDIHRSDDDKESSIV